MHLCGQLSAEVIEKQALKISSLYKDWAPNVWLMVIKSLFYISHFHKGKFIEEKISKIISSFEKEEDYCINTFIKSIHDMKYEEVSKQIVEEVIKTN